MRISSMCLSLAVFALAGCGNPLDKADYERAAVACGEAGVAKATRGPDGIAMTCNETSTTQNDAGIDQAAYLLLPAISDAEYDVRELSTARLTGRERPEMAISRLLSGFEPPAGEGAALYTQTGYKLSEAEPVRIVVERTGLMDDSVSGERHVIEYPLNNEGEREASAYGVQVQCARGNLAGKWGKGPCS